MKIECILKRPGGTRVEIGGTDYHFNPQPDGTHVADVTDRDHIGRFLSISEGYKIADGETAPGPAPSDPKPEQPNPAPGSDPKPEQPQSGSTPERPATDAADGYDAMERDALVEIYAERFGTRPPARIGKPAIISALREQA